jgi:hypothetical protein
MCQVRPLPDEIRNEYKLDAFYKRYASANGIPVLASEKPMDEAIKRACLIVIDETSNPQVRKAALANDIRFALMASSEKSVDVPEFTSLGDLDWRERGLGGVPVGLCAEENVLCNSAEDRWRGESICTHEYSHTIGDGAIAKADPNYPKELAAALKNALAKGLWNNTYAESQPAEYWAEGVQSWFNTNLSARSGESDGTHNQINTRAELKDYDPGLYALIAKWMPDQPKYKDCYYYDK